MSASGFARDAAHSVFEALRPSTDQTLDRAAFATYSLDLVAVAALVLSLGRAGEQELEAGPLSLVDALATVAPRIDIVFQKDRLKPTAGHHGVLHMLDRRIHAVQPPRGASYHPKLALVRYLGPGKAVTWKLWLGSRNLTGGQDREAGLLLVGRVGGKSGKRMPIIAAMTRDLLEPAPWIAGSAAELASVRWRAPDGVTLRGFQWRRAGERNPFNVAMRGAIRTVAISPFVDDVGCTAFDDCPANLLLTTGDAAADLKPRSDIAVAVCRPPTFDVAMPVEPRAAPPAVDDVSVPEPAGLHAKLLLRQKGATNRLWIGSANLTRRGMDGPNAELMAELDVPADVAKALTAYAEDGAPFDRDMVEPDPDLATRRAAERALDDAVVVVVRADMGLSRGQEGLTLTSGTSFDDFLSGHRLEAWLLTRHDAVAAWPSGAQSVLLVPGGVPLKLETVLVCFRAERLQKDCPPRVWAQAVPFPGHDADARDRAATAAYIGLAGASASVRAQLEASSPPRRPPGRALGGGRARNSRAPGRNSRWRSRRCSPRGRATRTSSRRGRGGLRTRWPRSVPSSPRHPTGSRTRRRSRAGLRSRRSGRRSGPQSVKMHDTGALSGEHRRSCRRGADAQGRQPPLPDRRRGGAGQDRLRKGDRGRAPAAQATAA